MTTPSVRSCAVLLALLALACGGEERRSDEPADAGAPPSAQPATTTAPAAPVAAGDTVTEAAIRTTDGNVEMALRGDRLQIGLSDKVLGEVREKLATDSAGSSSGLGGMIKGIVSSTVQGALATRAEYPLDEIEEFSYDGERLRLVVRGKGPQLEHMDVNKRPLMASFPPEDARRFVESVRAAKARRAEGR